MGVVCNVDIFLFRYAGWNIYIYTLGSTKWVYGMIEARARLGHSFSPESLSVELAYVWPHMLICLT